MYIFPHWFSVKFLGKVFIFIDDITVERVADQSKEQTKSKDVAGVLEAVGH